LKAGKIIVVMGVTGCGKSSVARELANQLGTAFVDADDYHPKTNIEKMSAGIPLTDIDRWPWLNVVSTVLNDEVASNQIVVAACSMLRRAYRDHLIEKTHASVVFIYLSGTRDTIAERMSQRQNHFMPMTLLESQFQILEPPDPDESAIQIDIKSSITEITQLIRDQIDVSDLTKTHDE